MSFNEWWEAAFNPGWLTPPGLESLIRTAAESAWRAARLDERERAAALAEAAGSFDLARRIRRG